VPNFDLTLQEVATAFPTLQILNRLGAGGQKVVYKVQTDLGEIAALKISARSSSTSTARTAREYEAAAKVFGDNFAQIFEVGEAKVTGQDCDFLLEEFIDGVSLRNHLSTGPQPLAHIKHVGESLLTALAEVEVAKLVHRDIKPENIMIRTDGRIVLIDFGIARHLDEASLTSDFAILGPLSYGYCAPEQINNQKRAISIKTDLFALGVVLYELATGKNPFVVQGDPQETLRRSLFFNPPTLASLGFSQSFSKFVTMCMDKSPHKRPPTISRAKTAFERIDWNQP